MPRYLAGAAVGIVMVLVSNWAIGAVGYEDANVLAIEKPRGVPIVTYTAERLRQNFIMHDLITATPWSEGKMIRFRGPRLKDLLARNGLDQEEQIEVFAFDEFVTWIRMQEIDDYDPILAIARACSDEDRAAQRCADDQDYTPLPMKEAGPFFVVWPIKELPRSYVPARNSIWVWFVVALRPAQ